MKKPFSGYQGPIIFFAVVSPALRKFKTKSGDSGLRKIVLQQYVLRFNLQQHFLETVSK